MMLWWAFLLVLAAAPSAGSKLPTSWSFLRLSPDTVHHLRGAQTSQAEPSMEVISQCQLRAVHPGGIGTHGADVPHIKYALVWY